MIKVKELISYFNKYIPNIIIWQVSNLTNIDINNFNDDYKDRHMDLTYYIIRIFYFVRVSIHGCLLVTINID